MNLKYSLLILVLFAVGLGTYFQFWFAPINTEVVYLEKNVIDLQVRLKENRAVAENLEYFRKEVGEKCGTLDQGSPIHLPEIPRELLAPLPQIQSTLIQSAQLFQLRDQLKIELGEIQKQIKAHEPVIREVDRLRQLSLHCKK